MSNVKYSVEFNARQVARLIGEKGCASVALVTTARSGKAVDAFREGLLSALSAAGMESVAVSACPDYLRNADSVLACESCDGVILLEKYGTTSHRGLDEALDILQSQNRTVLGVVALK